MSDLETAPRVGVFELHETANRLVSTEGVVTLSPLATRFLALLSRRPGQVVARDALIAELWRGNHLVGEDGLNRLVSEVRNALGDSARQPRIIQTVPKVGYRLIQGAPPEPLLWPRKPVTGRDLIVSRLLLIVAIVLAAVAANWVLETAIGVIWAMRNA